jgi:hypothetical protein
MRSTIVLAGAVVTLAVVALPSQGHAPSESRATRCGEERWAVKTLSDKRERLVDYGPHDSSVGRLRKKPHPHVGPDTKRQRMDAYLLDATAGSVDPASDRSG